MRFREAWRVRLIKIGVSHRHAYGYGHHAACSQEQQLAGVDSHLCAPIWQVLRQDSQRDPRGGSPGLSRHTQKVGPIKSASDQPPIQRSEATVPDLHNLGGWLPAWLHV